MDAPNKNYSTTGIHAGSLWKLGDAAHLYLTSLNGSSHPLTNPEFKKAFVSAQTIAVSYFNEKAHDSPETLSLTLENSVADDSELCDLAEIMKKHLSLAKVEKLNKKLIESSLFSHPSINNYYDEDPYKVCVIRLFRRFGYIVLQEKNPNMLIESIIIEEARKSSKNIISLFSINEFQKNTFDAFKNIFEIPHYFLCLEIFLFPKDGIDDMMIFVQEEGKSWDLGAISPSITIPCSSITDERAENFSNQMIKKFSCAKEEVPKTLKKIIKFCVKENLISAEKVADKISPLLENEKNVLILQTSLNHEGLFSKLTEKKIELIGPLKENINPRGFLFEIKKVDTVVGYFLGSIHLTPQWILENFNSKIREAFEFCNVLGVEVDVTRDDVKKAFNQQEEFDIPQERILLLKEFVSAGLKDIQAEFMEADDQIYIKKGFEFLVKGLQNTYGIESGIDLTFIEKAKKRGMDIVDLESIETHMEFLKLMKTEQVDFIQNSKAKTPEEHYFEFKNYMLKKICGYYPLVLETGYIKALDGDRQRHSKAMKAEMISRDMEMAMTTHKLIRSGKKPFSIEGGEHLVGEKSMIQMMRDMGYTVTQIICEEPLGT